MPVKSTTSVSQSSSSSTSQYSIDVIPVVTLCNQTSVPNDPRLQEFIKLFEKQNIEEFFQFISKHQDFLGSNLNLNPYDLILMFRRLMIWNLLKFEVYISLESLRDKLRCSNVEMTLEAMQDVQNYDHYLSKTLRVQLSRFFKLSATPKALMSENIVELMVECASYKIQTGNQLPINNAATTLAIGLTQSVPDSVKTIRLEIDVYRKHKCQRRNVIDILKATSAMLGNGHPSLIYVDIAIIALHSKAEMQETAFYVNRVIDYMTSLPCMRYTKAFFKLPLIINESQQKLVEAMNAGEFDKIRTCQAPAPKIELLLKISRIYKMLNFVEEKEIHNIVDLCKGLQFTNTEEVYNFLHEVREYIAVESDEYGAHLVPSSNAAAAESTPRSSTK